MEQKSIRKGQDMDYFGRIAEILVTVILLFLVPLSYMSAKSELLCQTYIVTETAYFVDSVRNIGFVDRQMYDTFVKRLAVTNLPYEIRMSHYKTRLKEQEEGVEIGYLPYYQGVYHEEMLNSLLSTEPYFFHKGDFFSVSVRKIAFTWGDYLEAFLTGRNQREPEMQVVYGGSIRDESY